jgi:hypothetical protein
MRTAGSIFIAYEMADSVKCIERDAAEVKQSRSIPLQTEHTAEGMNLPATSHHRHLTWAKSTENQNGYLQLLGA